jgi:hypothetical protein
VSRRLHRRVLQAARRPDRRDPGRRGVPGGPGRRLLHRARFGAGHEPARRGRRRPDRAGVRRRALRLPAPRQRLVRRRRRRGGPRPGHRAGTARPGGDRGPPAVLSRHRRGRARHPRPRRVPPRPAGRRHRHPAGAGAAGRGSRPHRAVGPGPAGRLRRLLGARRRGRPRPGGDARGGRARAGRHRVPRAGTAARRAGRQPALSGCRDHRVRPRLRPRRLVRRGDHRGDGRRPRPGALHRRAAYRTEGCAAQRFATPDGQTRAGQVG